MSAVFSSIPLHWLGTRVVEHPGKRRWGVGRAQFDRFWWPQTTGAGHHFSPQGSTLVACAWPMLTTSRDCQMCFLLRAPQESDTIVQTNYGYGYGSQLEYVCPYILDIFDIENQGQSRFLVETCVCFIAFWHGKLNFRPNGANKIITGSYQGMLRMCAKRFLDQPVALIQRNTAEIMLSHVSAPWFPKYNFCSGKQGTMQKDGDGPRWVEKPGAETWLIITLSL